MGRFGRYHAEAQPPDATEFCNQCYRDRPLAMFVSSDGTRIVRRCSDCRKRYQNWDSLSTSERAARMRPKPRDEHGETGYFVALALRSNNRKTGPIPVSMTDMSSCPSSCAFRDKGCYAEFGKTRMHWQSVATRGMTWRQFCSSISRLAKGTLWRHNEAGDLPGKDDELDIRALAMLVAANAGRRGFTFTHRPLTKKSERDAVRTANALGFTINLSANTLEQADELAELAVAPVVVVVGADEDLREARTPAGRKVIACLAESDGLTCAKCKLCAQPQRQAIIAFRAHGQASAIVTELVRGKRREAPAA